MRKLPFALLLIPAITIAVASTYAADVMTFKPVSMLAKVPKDLVIAKGGFAAASTHYKIFPVPSTEQTLSNGDVYVYAYVTGPYPKELHNLFTTTPLEVFFRSYLIESGEYDGWRAGLWDECSVLGDKFTCIFPAPLDLFTNLKVKDSNDKLLKKVDLMVGVKRANEDNKGGTPYLGDATADVMKAPHTQALTIGDINANGKPDIEECESPLETSCPWDKNTGVVR